MNDLGKRPIVLRIIPFLILLAALFCLFWIFPISGDDWFREGLGRNIHSVGDLVREVTIRWQTTNSRILGNVLAYISGSRPILREILRTIFTFGTIFFAAKCSGSRTWSGVYLAAALILALPREMFRQIYPWAAGFFNYVPPVTLLLLAFSLLSDMFEGKLIADSPARVASLCLLGFCAQLFIENDSLYAVCAGLFLLIAYGVYHKKCSASLFGFFAGTVLGALLLFSSPCYRLIVSGDRYHADLGNGLAGLLKTAGENQAEVLRFLILGCPVLFLSLTVLSVVHFIRKHNRAVLDWVIALLLMTGCGFFIINQVSSLFDQLATFRIMVVLVWGLSLGAGLFRWTSGAVRNRGLFYWASSVIAAAPLLFIQPIGPRCLYISYVFLLIVAGNLLFSLPISTGASRWIVSVLCLGFVIGSCLRIYLPLHRIDRAQMDAVRAGMSAGETEISLPAYPSHDYLWEADSSKIEYAFYYETPGDITFTYTLHPHQNVVQ